MMNSESLPRYMRWSTVPKGLHTKTQWREQGRIVLRNATPDATFYSPGLRKRYALYSKEKTREKQTVIKRPPEMIDVLAAIWTVTRSAKRYRDAASACYHRKKHGFAGTNRRKKERLYELKDRGIVLAVQAKRLRLVGIHGGLCVYHGEGYCFHSTLIPNDLNRETLETKDETIYVEAKPKRTKEPRLCDAITTLTALPESIEGFQRLVSPSFSQKGQERNMEYEVYDPSECWDEQEEDDQE